MIDNNFKTIKMRVETSLDLEGFTTLSFSLTGKFPVKKWAQNGGFYIPAIYYGKKHKKRKREQFAEFEGIKEISHRVFYELVEHYSKNHVVGYYVRKDLVKNAKQKYFIGPFGEPVFSNEDKATLIEQELVKQKLQNGIYEHINTFAESSSGFKSFRSYTGYFCILHENFNKDFYIPLIREKVWREDFFNHLFIYKDQEIKKNITAEKTVEDYIKAEKILSINISDQYHFGRIKFVESVIDKDECVQLVQELFAKYGVTVELFAEDSEEMLIYSKRRNFYEKKVYPIVDRIGFTILIPMLVIFLAIYSDAIGDKLFDATVVVVNWFINLFSSLF